MENEAFEEFRRDHLARTLVVWEKLAEFGVTSETKLDFDFTFVAPSRKAVQALSSALSDYELTEHEKGWLRRRWIVEGRSGPLCWTKQLLLDWTDYLITVGRDTGCEFDGCGASAPPSV